MHTTIIGGSGFIGTRLTKRLQDTKHKIAILDKQKSDTFPGLWKSADVRDLKSLQKELKSCKTIINLAAEHRDDVTPKSLYDDVNVQGARNICQAAEEHGIVKIIFTSSVAVYGFAPKGTDENGKFNPFNDYGRTKMEAEKIFHEWVEKDQKRTLVIIRPTVVFGERNRGNVFNLLKQIASGKFLMTGNGKNVKSMAYVENVAAFIEHSLSFSPGVHVYNYIDKPDFDMNTLVKQVNKTVGRGDKIGFRLPYVLGYLGGLIFDFAAKITGRKFPISSIRVKKFCADTMFETSIRRQTGFIPPVSLEDALERTIRYEFLEEHDEKVFYSE